MTGRLCSELDRAEGMVGCGALRCLNVSIKYKKQVDRYEKIVEESHRRRGGGQEGKVRIYLLCFNIHCKLLKAGVPFDGTPAHHSLP